MIECADALWSNLPHASTLCEVTGLIAISH
jgi:hypothetical protein